MSNYRVVVQYDSARSVYTARAPELHHISGEGATRSEALAHLEEEIDAQVANAREGGGSLPPAADGELEESWSGEVMARVTRGLHRELAFQARVEGVELGPLVGEMLAQALEARRQQRRRAAPPAGERDERSPAASGQGQGQGNAPGPGPGNDRRPQPYRGGQGQGQGGRYHAIMEDRATFLEYVRGLESGGGAPRNRGDRRRGPTGGGGGGRGGGGGTPGGDEGGSR
jgi:predicted RNase H-like HicB family nuclease